MNGLTPDSDYRGDKIFSMMIQAKWVVKKCNPFWSVYALSSCARSTQICHNFLNFLIRFTWGIPKHDSGVCPHRWRDCCTHISYGRKQSIRQACMLKLSSSLVPDHWHAQGQISSLSIWKQVSKPPTQTLFLQSLMEQRAGPIPYIFTSALPEMSCDGIIGVAAAKEITTHIAWTPAKLFSWGSLPSKRLLKCSMTASKVSKTKVFCKVHTVFRELLLD